ncbi:MAG TPA: alpha/beta hydrolase [bacterium]|jgi:pimeloyl-ACP methyl ester carboxylesterase|nr:alpha/beta hydrolase [bacterium]
MPYATANGIQLYYERLGEGLPVVLVSGLGADAHFWYRQVPSLSRQFEVITLDNRGACRSDKPDEPYTIRMMAGDVAGLLDALEIPAAHLVGASLGGFIVQEFALGYPERTRRVVLCCTSFGGPRSVPIPPQTAEVLLSRTGDPARDLRAFLAVQFGTDFLQTHPEEIDDYVAWRVAHPQPPFAYQRQLMAATGHDTESRIGDWRGPVLILHGGQDRVVPVANGELLAQRIAGSRLHVFPDAGHLFLWEQSSSANQMIAEFLTG